MTCAPPCRPSRNASPRAKQGLATLQQVGRPWSHSLTAKCPNDCGGRVMLQNVIRILGDPLRNQLKRELRQKPWRKRLASLREMPLPGPPVTRRTVHEGCMRGLGKGGGGG